MRKIFYKSIIFLMIFSCMKDSTSVQDNSITGEYVFIEMWIFSSAKKIAGNCDIINPATGEDYHYNPSTQEFEYTRKPEFPVNDELKMIYGQKHQYNPIAGYGGVTVSIVPVYYMPDLLTGNATVEGVLKNNTVVLGINIKSYGRNIYLPEDSVFVHVINTIEEGPGDSCIWEYTDSLVITNYGLNPKSKINYLPSP